MDNSWIERLVAQQGDGPALTTSTTATSILLGQAKLLIGAGGFKQNDEWRVSAGGRISTLTVAPGTLTLDLRLGSTVVWNGGAMALNTTAQTNATWQLEVDLNVRSIGDGTLATLLGIGRWTSRAVIGSAAAAAGGAGTLLLPDTAPTAGSGFNSATASNQLDLFATWSVSNAANSIQAHRFSADLCT